MATMGGGNAGVGGGGAMSPSTVPVATPLVPPPNPGGYVGGFPVNPNPNQVGKLPPPPPPSHKSPASDDGYGSWRFLWFLMGCGVMGGVQQQINKEGLLDFRPPDLPQPAPAPYRYKYTTLSSSYSCCYLGYSSEAGL